MESTAILIREARRILNGESFDEAKIKVLAKKLRDRNGFAYAAQLYEKLTNICKAEDQDKYYRELAFCTYKDPDLPSAVKFELAESFLSKIRDPLKSQNYDLLGMMGGIHKQRWMFDNRFRHLLFSRYFYQEGYDLWTAAWLAPLPETPGQRKFAGRKGDKDAGYTAINYAFLLDLMADVRASETRELYKGQKSLEHIEGWRKEAQKIRQEIVAYFEADELCQDPKRLGELRKADFFDYWNFATLGEAYFGLGDFVKAEFFYNLYGQAKYSAWAYDTTRKQVLALADIYVRANTRDVELRSDSEEQKTAKKKAREAFQTNVRKCLYAISPPAEIADDKDKPPISIHGKVGLGLSGGGFRASLYHIGTLAKLAELDVLRRVEAISCVSGGSIIGAYYYLLLRRKLMEKYDEPYTYMHAAETAERVLSQQDYLDIVEDLTTHFLTGVQKNLRMRILSSWKNLRIFLDRSYTRSHRIAELYEEFLYKPIFTGADGTGAYDEKTLLMQNLRIMPRGAQAFNPKTDNWNRTHKVPTLVLNATSLNTGHNWQFTASWMGEPPGNIIQRVDSKPRLRRMYYDEAPAPYTNNIRLGRTVGASSCVPALFEPIYMPNLYPGVDLRLVDGGVHDNQGVGSLIEQECSILIISDASGQLNIENTTGAGALGSFARSDAVFQERIRELQYMDIEARRESNQIKGLMYIHLKSDLNKSPMKWNGCNDPTRRIWLTEDENPNSPVTQYGIQKSVQERLACLRTDLDAFNDAEAYALMYSAYRQTEWAFKNSGLSEQLPPPANPAGRDWAFFSVAPFMEDAAEKSPLERRLEVGADLPFKVLRAYRVLSTIKTVLVLMLVVGIYWAAKTHWDWLTETRWLNQNIPMPSIALSAVVFAAVAFGVDAFLGFGASKFAEYRSFFLKKALGAVGSLVVMAVFRLYLAVFNPIYLYWGKIENLRRTSRASKVVARVLDFLF